MVNRKSDRAVPSRGLKATSPLPVERITSPAGALLPKTCNNCTHFVALESNGYCRRYPPSLKIDGVSSCYVPVKSEWTCGEFAHGQEIQAR